jgi:hypothetical protein
VDTVWSGTWTQDWTGFAVLPTSGAPLLLSTKSGIGYTAVDRIGADATDQPLWTGREPPGWSALMPFDAAGAPGTALLYNQQTGALKAVEVSPVGLKPVYTDQLDHRLDGHSAARRPRASLVPDLQDYRGDRHHQPPLRIMRNVKRGNDIGGSGSYSRKAATAPPGA